MCVWLGPEDGGILIGTFHGSIDIVSALCVNGDVV